MIVLITVH